MMRLQSWFRLLTQANRTPARKNRSVTLGCEELEVRAVPSTLGGLAKPGGIEAACPHGTSPNDAAGFRGYTPDQVQHAYGFDRIDFGGIPGDGRGQTIAIIDAYDDPNIASDLRAFDWAFGLPDPNFYKVAQDGSTNYPRVDPAGPGAPHGWEGEEALDVEWAHAMAPAANLLLVEASDPRHLDTAVRYAEGLPDVSVISMSYGHADDAQTPSSDGLYTTPPGHQGITFVESSGDDGTLQAPSANVLIVGGTSLFLDGNGDIQDESAWGSSGGGISQYEPPPGYQQGVVPGPVTGRAAPDVAYDADPGTGFAVYDSYDHLGGWTVTGGTSAGAPQWAALVAIADQGRAAAGQGSLDGRSQTLPMLYALAGSSAFHDITRGGNAGYSAGPGYDPVTGLGSPVADQVVAGLVGPTTGGTATGGALAARGVAAAVPAHRLFDGTVATFTSTGSGLTAADFTAQIDWGNGTTTTATIQDGGDGTFRVVGEYIYDQAGPYTITVQVQDAWGDTATAQSTMTVESDARPTPTPPTRVKPPPSGHEFVPPPGRHVTHVRVRGLHSHHHHGHPKHRTRHGHHR